LFASTLCYFRWHHAILFSLFNFFFFSCKLKCMLHAFPTGIQGVCVCVCVCLFVCFEYVCVCVCVCVCERECVCVCVCVCVWHLSLQSDEWRVGRSGDLCVCVCQSAC